MPVNTTPIFPHVPVVTGATLTAANTTKDLTSGSISLIYTAGSNGSRVDRIRARARGTNVATVLRIFLNNGGATGTASNNLLLAEVSLPATTNSETAAVSGATQEIPNANTVPDTTGFPLAIPAGYRLYATIGTAVAAGWDVIAMGGDY